MTRAKLAAWYKRALGATQLWSLDSVVGLEMAGAPFFLREPTAGFVSPVATGTTTVRVEVFVDDPDSLVGCAVDDVRDERRALDRLAS